MRNVKSSKEKNGWFTSGRDWTIIKVICHQMEHDTTLHITIYLILIVLFLFFIYIFSNFNLSFNIWFIEG
jgi:hypothetical protein